MTISIDVRCIQQRHSEFDSPVDCVDGLIPIRRAGAARSFPCSQGPDGGGRAPQIHGFHHVSHFLSDRSMRRTSGYGVARLGCRATHRRRTAPDTVPTMCVSHF